MTATHQRDGHAGQFATVADADVVVVTQMLSASRRGDWWAVRSRLHPLVVWTLPGSSHVSGILRGRDAVIATAQEIDAARLTVEPLHVLRGRTTVVVTIHNTAGTPVPLDEQLALVFRLEGGLITGIDTHLSDVPGLDRFYAAVRDHAEQDAVQSDHPTEEPTR